MQMGLGMGLSTPYRGLNTLAGLLFSAGHQGFTFEPWDITTLYQDRAGTTPVTAVGQSVGYRRDKSGRGNHEVAINDAARGVYGREPKGGTRNLLRHTSQFSDGYWTLGSTLLTANAATSPIGDMTADLLYPSTTGNYRFIRQTSYSPWSGAYTVSIYAKMAGVRYLVAIDTDGSGAGVGFDLQAGTRTLSGISASDGTTATITSVSNGWYRCSYTSTNGYLYLYLSDAINGVAVTANGTNGVYIWGAQIETGASLTAYQAVVTQYDVTEAGVASCYYVQTDGVDDAYVTPTITPGTDKAQVFMGLQKIGTGATAQIIAEMSVTRAANNGAFTVGVPGSVAGAGAFLVSRGTVDAIAQVTTGYTPPTHVVLTGLADISGDIATLRANGSQIAQATTDQGTGNFLAYPAHLYARGGTTQPSALRDYGHAGRFGPNLDAATIARVEALIARNTPVVTL